MNPILCCDSYKTEHHIMMPDNVTRIYSNLTPRKSRLQGVESIVVFGFQHFFKEYLVKKFQTEFFDKPWEQIDEEYKYAIHVNTDHIKHLWELKYLPLRIKCLPEGSRCPTRVPCMTITNTHADFAWLVNYLETLISCCIWQSITSATIAAEYHKLLSKYAIETTGSSDFVQWQGHDFSMRGMSSLESAILSGMGHLTSFTGTDTIPAIYALRGSYNTGETLIGASVPATEHSVMCMGTKDDELGTFKSLLEKYPVGILSVVSDTWNLWKVCTSFLPALKADILARDGKLVIRPDSGDPCDIICGKNTYFSGLRTGQVIDRTDPLNAEMHGEVPEPEWKGVIELLWDVFGGKINNNGYKELDSHIGAIYGDSITLDRCGQICERLKAKGFASTNVVFGIGSYTYQHNTRDTFGFAMKATYGELRKFVEGKGWVTEGREIFKDPITDDGTKKSAKGLLSVHYSTDGYILRDQCTWEEEQTGALETVFLDGKIVKEYTLEEIRNRIKSYI